MKEKAILGNFLFNIIYFSMNETLEKLKLLRNEDLIWIIYFFIAAFALLSNKYDRDYLFNQNIKAYQKEKTINISIFLVAFFIYLYFVLLQAQNLKNIKQDFNSPKFRSTFVQLIAAILFLIGGSIYLINEIYTNDSGDIGII